MERADWLILLFGFKGAARPALDPVRTQHGMFLFARWAAVDSSELYAFQPCAYGPRSFELRGDLDRLVTEGLVVAEPITGYTWGRYKLTRAGLEEARRVRFEAPRGAARMLFEIKQCITGKSFNSLIREVCDDYPEYAVNSIFHGAHPLALRR
jgi:hypothetical protein